MEIKGLRNLATEIFKAVNSVDPSFLGIYLHQQGGGGVAGVRPAGMVVGGLGAGVWGTLPGRVGCGASLVGGGGWIGLWCDIWSYV